LRKAEQLKPRAYVEVERHLSSHSKPLHQMPLAAIDRRTIAGLLTGLAATRGPGAANRTRSSLGAYFVWLMREGLIEANPVVTTNKQPESGARDRVLDDSELKALWKATGDGSHYSAIVRLLSLTAARRDEIGLLQWAEADLDQAAITLRGERTKNRRPFVIPLNPAALEILEAQQRRSDRDFVFGRGRGGYSGWSASKADLDRRLPIASWVVHDLRRTISTIMHERLGVQPHIVEAVLGHVSGHQGGVAGVYNKASYIVEKRRALELWAEHLLAVVEERPAKVVSLRA
jgi:integrase